MTDNTNTSILRYGSPLVRKQWAMDNLIECKSQSVFDGLKGNSSEAVIYQVNDFSQKKGQTIIFDYKGMHVAEGFRGKETAIGNAAPKKKFSDSLTLEYGRYTIDNGMEFDAATVGDMSLAEHSDSMSMLSDMNVRSSDQMFFDLGSGFLNGATPTSIIRDNVIADMTATDKMTWERLVKLETIAKTGIIKGVQRRQPIKPYKLQNGRKVWLVMLDAFQIQDLLLDAKFQAIYQNADVRGKDNVLLSHAIAQVGNLVIMEVGTFAGTSSSNLLFKQAVQAQGLRTIDENGTFSGDDNTAQTGVVASRGLLLGAGAFQYGTGSMPDYKFQASPDFEITSESALILTHQVGKTQLTAEVDDYKDAKVADIDFGIMVIDTYNETLSA